MFSFEPLVCWENAFLGLMVLSRLTFIAYGTNFAQILYDRINHWETLSSFSKNEVKLYDSLSKPISSSIERQIAQLVFCRDPSIRIIRASVQQQSNSINCSLFAIAFAFDIAAGMNRTF